MRPYPKLSTWLSAFVGTLPIWGLLIYGVFHVGLGIPLRWLVEPSILTAVLHILLAPFMYWSWRHHALSRADLRLVFVSLGAWFLLWCLLCVHYGIRFGLLSRDDSLFYYVVVLLSVPAGFTAAFFLGKMIQSDR